MNSTKKERNLLIGIGLLAGFSVLITFGYFCYVFPDDNTHNTLTLFVMKDYQQLVEEEVRLFDKTHSKNCQVGVETYSEEKIVELFEQHPGAMIVLPYKLEETGLSNLKPNRLPLKQKFVAGGLVGSPVKALYLIQDAKVFGLERKFEEFLFSKTGQSIVFKEGYVPARMGF